MYFPFSGIGSAAVINCCAGVVTSYFKQNRNLALGLIFAGLSLGAVCAPFSMKELFETYSYMESCIFIAGFQLHIVVFSSLLRPLNQSKYLRKQMDNLDHSIQSTLTIKGVVNLGYTSTSDESISHAAVNKNMFGDSLMATETSPQHGRNSDEQQNSKFQFQSGNDSIDRCCISSISKDNITETQTAQPEGSTTSSTVRKASISDSLKLLIDETFLVIGLSAIGLTLIVSTFETGLVALTIEGDITAEDTAVLVTVIFTTDTVSRTLLGIVLDQPFLKPHLRFIYAFLSMVHGCGAIIIWFAGSNLPLFYIAGCTQNLAKGSLFAQQYSLLMDLFGKDKFQSSIGMTHFLMGVGFLSGPFILGM